MNVRTKAEEDERANAASAAAAASLEVDKAAASTSGPKDPGDSPLMLAEERKRLEKRTMELEVPFFESPAVAILSGHFPAWGSSSGALTGGAEIVAAAQVRPSRG